MKAIWLDPVRMSGALHWHLVIGRETPIEPPGPLVTVCGYAVAHYNGSTMSWDEPPDGPNRQGTVCANCLLQLANLL